MSQQIPDIMAKVEDAQIQAGSALAKQLPEWDLLPPSMPVQRIRRIK